MASMRVAGESPGKRILYRESHRQVTRIYCLYEGLVFME
jgi:hypothetical protein